MGACITAVHQKPRVQHSAGTVLPGTQVFLSTTLHVAGFRTAGRAHVSPSSVKLHCTAAGQLLSQYPALFALPLSLEFVLFSCRAGEHPLLRLVLQPPTDGLLQPGGTFGLLLDFRAAHGGQAAAASSGSSSSTQPVCLQVGAMHDIMLCFLQLPCGSRLKLHHVVVTCWQPLCL